MSLHKFVNPKADSADTTITRPSDWNAAHATPVVAAAGNHTIAATDAGKTIRVTAAGTVTVDNLAVGDDVTVLAATTGTVTIAAGGAFTVDSRGGVFTLAGQWAVATIYCDATNHAVVTGDIA